ncbi:squamosa promoter-binding-like protein 2 isoform X2 [Silene latifolia]|uniref:squamosa promoter-binding-like protein 2 isoform X2 n=1 Tax=Silene latifolia TaxID=37657 RepID=UPI003D77C827
MMESHARNPFMYDLENLVMFSTKVGESPKTLQFVESEIERMEAFEAGSFYSSGGHSDGGTGSDLGYASSSRSSKTASDHSSTDREIKETNFSLETNDCFQQDLGRKRELAKSELGRTSPTVESSAVSGESLIALELCNRTYFEDKSRAGNVKNNDSSAKKSKSSSLSLEMSRCQVEGCNVNLSSAKEYHKKHRVCESHAKCPLVVINGHERRFCQQCSRFHSLSEFDQKKRSCRRRLSDHNARRRKPKPEIIQFNSMRLATSLYEGRNQLNFGFNQAPMLHTRPGSWDNIRDSKVVQEKPGLFNLVKGGTNGSPYTYDELQTPVTKTAPVSTHFLPPKGEPSEVYHRGSMGPTNVDAAQELRALSLLSTSTWGSCDPHQAQLDHHTLQSFPAMDPVPLGGPPVSSDFWISDQQAGSGHGSQTPSFQLFKAPNEASYYHY